MSTLSVEISTSASSTSTLSPTLLSHCETVPSVTDSPRAGSVTSVPEAVPPPEDGWSSAGFSCAGSSFGCSGAACSGSSCGASAAGASSAGASPSSPMMARTSPTSMVSSSLARISSRVPATGEGTSVSTLSVEISTSASSTSTRSPTLLSHCETVPSVTLSPSAGRVTEVDMYELLNVRFLCVAHPSRNQSGAWRGLPARAMAASPSASFWVGCACTNWATSSAWAPHAVMS